MSPSRPGIPRAPRPNPDGRGGSRHVPLERGRAAGVLSGLLAFGVGFLVAALAGLAGQVMGPLYLTGLGIAFAGIGCVAFFLNRGTVPLPEGSPIWSRVGLAKLAEALGLPALGVQIVVYGLIGLGVVGNVVLPLVR